MSDLTPHPERVTLTDEEVEALQDETGNSGHYVKGILAPAVERILAARREADAETIRGLRGDVAALADEYLCEWEKRTEAGTATKAHAAMYGAAHRLRAILACHERPEGETDDDPEQHEWAEALHKAAREEGVAAVAGPVLALIWSWHGDAEEPRSLAEALDLIRAAIPTDAAEALARVRAEAWDAAVQEAEDRGLLPDVFADEIRGRNPYRAVAHEAGR